MEQYTFLRALADSWFLLAMFGFFIGAVAWSWRPGATRAQADAASIVFDHDDAPADPKGAQS